VRDCALDLLDLWRGNAIIPIALDVERPKTMLSVQFESNRDRARGAGRDPILLLR
jgi:hypothetical protein